MLHVTPLAIRHLVAGRDQRGLGPEAGARFAPSSTGIGVSYARSPQPGDRTIDAGDIELYVAEELAEKFDSATIDVDDKDGGTALVIKPHPNARTRPS